MPAEVRPNGEGEHVGEQDVLLEAARRVGVQRVDVLQEVFVAECGHRDPKGGASGPPRLQDEVLALHGAFYLIDEDGPQRTVLIRESDAKRESADRLVEQSVVEPRVQVRVSEVEDVPVRVWRVTAEREWAREESPP